MLATRRALLAGFAAAPAIAALPSLSWARDRKSESDAALDAAFAEHAPPAMAAGVVGRDGLIWSGARGVRVVEGADPVSVDQKWHLGSNGKAMTAMLYARLVEQGRAKWGATLGDIFAGQAMDDGMKAITIDELLCHTSGLKEADIMNRDRLMAAHADRRPPHEHRADFARDLLGKAPTGERGVFGYSNSGYVLAGAAIETTVGKPWEEVIQIDLFDPLGMTTAGHGAPQGDNPWGHRILPDGKWGAADPTRAGDNPAPFGPAGRMHMSVADYGKFLRLYVTQGGGFVSAATMDKLLTPSANMGERPYAYGWGLRTGDAWAAGGPTLYHNGTNTMWYASANVAPARGLAVFSIANERTRGEVANRAVMERLIAIHAT